jgi:hypothetical protein
MAGKFMVVRKDDGQILAEDDKPEDAIEMLRGFGAGCIVARAADGKVIAERKLALAGKLPWAEGGHATAISIHWGI